MTSLAELLEIPSSRGRRSKLTASKRRDIVPSDIAALESAKPLEQVTPVQQLRHQHHLLARLLAEGKQVTEAAEITGYSITYISRLQTQDRAFRELISYYKSQVGEVFINVHERLAGLGLNTVEELQDRLAVTPQSFTHRELFELAELCFDRGGYGPTSTQKSVVTLLTPETIDALKREVARRQNGTVREISPSNSRSSVGGPVLDLTVSEATSEGVQSKGNDVSTAGREMSLKDIGL